MRSAPAQPSSRWWAAASRIQCGRGLRSLGGRRRAGADVEGGSRRLARSRPGPSARRGRHPGPGLRRHPDPLGGHPSGPALRMLASATSFLLRFSGVRG